MQSTHDVIDRVASASNVADGLSRDSFSSFVRAPAADVPVKSLLSDLLKDFSNSMARGERLAS